MPSGNEKKIGVGLIGFGTVGGGVVKLLFENRGVIRQKTGLDLELRKIADRNPDADRALGFKVPAGILTSSADDVLNDPQIQIVVELVGGIEPAKSFILKAFSNGKSVVTANKKLLAAYGPELFAAAKKHNVDFFFEASVAGGIPLLKSVREGLVANNITRVFGIVNGTCNYILTKMSEDGLDFQTALKQAQEKGFAEADPSFDIDGNDSADKLAVLAFLSWGLAVPVSKIHTEGIRNVEKEDIKYASDLGYSLKLLAIAKSDGKAVEARVHPTLLPKTHLLSSVRNEYNAVYVEGDAVGSTVFYGKGAGRMPTASAVVADVVDIARNISRNCTGRVSPEFAQPPALVLKPMPQVNSQYYVRMYMVDTPGTLARVATIFGEHEINIDSVIQAGGRGEKIVPVVFTIHESNEKNLSDALAKIERLEIVKKKPVVIRMEQ